MPREVAADRTFALVVGIEKYDLGSDWDLVGPSGAAGRFAKWLLDCGVRPDHIFLFLSTQQRTGNAQTPPVPVDSRLTSREATENQLHEFIVEDLASRDGDLLIVYWAGHGVIADAVGGNRRLFYADATPAHKRNLDLQSLLQFMRTGGFQTPQQVCIIDACANRVGAEGVASRTFPFNKESTSGRRQFVLLATQPGQYARNLPADRSCLFTSELLGLLAADQSGDWPPDFGRLASELSGKFTEIRKAGRTQQAPTFLSVRGWDGEETSLGSALDSAPNLAPSRLFQLPSGLSDFVGREEEVRQLVTRLRGDGGRISLSALRGMGGIGKTTLAVQVAHEVKDQYPDAQLFLDLRGVDLHGLGQKPMTGAEVMARFIHAFHPDIPRLPEAEEELLPLYRSTLSGKRALVVLDNALDENQLKYLIAGDKSAFIITSRNALALDGVVSIQIDVLSPEKSLLLLRGIVGTKGSDEELRTVANLCGFLPLALRVAGDFLRLKVGWSVAQYIDALNAERHRWLKIGTDPQKDVEAVLKLSSAQLATDNLDLATRWHYLSDWPADFAADAAAAAWNLESDPHTVRDDLSTLVDRSLLLFDEKSSRYRLHDLMKPIAAGLFG
jgi:hypothetical protein